MITEEVIQKLTQLKLSLGGESQRWVIFEEVCKSQASSSVKVALISITSSAENPARQNFQKNLV